MMQNSEQSRAWVEVDLSALRANYEVVRGRVGPDVAMIPMVKANGYGLGAERVVRALEPLAPWGYGVAAAAEGAALRDIGITRPILLTSPLPPQDVLVAARAGLTASISDVASLERWRAAARVTGPLDFHVEVDTGMGRSGFDWRAAAEWGGAVLEEAALTRWTGIYTHMHSADAGAEGAAATRTQWTRFQDTLSRLPVPATTLLVHAANSATALRWPGYAANAVRPGIFLYGGLVLDAAAAAAEDVPSPAPVVSVRARVVLVRDAPPGGLWGMEPRTSPGRVSGGRRCRSDMATVCRVCWAIGAVYSCMVCVYR
jgi:alanine racemase